MIRRDLAPSPTAGLKLQVVKRAMRGSDPKEAGVNCPVSELRLCKQDREIRQRILSNTPSMII